MQFIPAKKPRNSLLFIAVMGTAGILALGATAYLAVTQAWHQEPASKDLVVAPPPATTPKSVPKSPPNRVVLPIKKTPTSEPQSNQEPKPAPIVANTPASEPAKPLTFKEAYAKAVKISDALDSDEPAKTEKALKLLTEFEIGQVRSYKNLFPPEAAGILISHGLNDRLWRLSRFMAQMDEDFKAVAEKLWEPSLGVEDIVLKMEKWGQINIGIRSYVAYAIKNDKKPFDSRARDAILSLGGKMWLEAH